MNYAKVIHDETPSCEGCDWAGEGVSHCHRCHRSDIPASEIMEHARIEHGYEPERWADGSLAITDTTLTPEHFG